MAKQPIDPAAGKTKASTKPAAKSKPAATTKATPKANGKATKSAPASQPKAEAKAPKAKTKEATPTGQEHFIKHLTIENFKSIRHLELQPKRINLFIGRPNTGKSNILEAMSLLGYSEDLAKSIRLNHVLHLWHDKIKDKYIKISTEKTDLQLSYHYEAALQIRIDGLLLVNKDEYKDLRQESGVQKDGKVNNPIRRSTPYSIPIEDWNLASHKPIFYKYEDLKKDILIREYGKLLPNGANLPYLLSASDKLHISANMLLKDDGFQLVPNDEEGELQFIRTDSKRILGFPYLLLADTFKRMVFFQTAILCNEEEILLLEEPEAHSYPPYVSMLASEIAASKTNQFFIATHSPYLLNTIWNAAGGSKEVQIYLTDYKDYETVVRPIPGEDVQFMMENKGDIFLNLDSFFVS